MPQFCYGRYSGKSLNLEATLRIGIDPTPRIEFYVRNGLLKTMPTAEQLRKVILQNAYASGLVERFKYYSGNSQDLFPTETKRQELRRVKFKAASTISKFKEPAMSEAVTPGTDTQHGEVGTARKPLSDRTLTYTFQFTPARFVVHCYYNPWHATTTSGLNVPLKYLIEHVVHAPAPSALWDVQLIHPDPRGPISSNVRLNRRPMVPA